MPEVADVFRCYGPASQERFGADLLPSHRRAMDDIIHCRTEALGGHLWQCDHCGQEHDVSHSCRHRSCPTCHRHDTAVWLAERRQELLPVPYFHVVLTLPQELRPLVRQNQQDLYDILIRAAAQSLITLAADPHYVGGLIGVLCVLHTWTRALAYHPHGHCLVPAGGVSADHQQWRPARQTYLVPVRALSAMFRGRFCALVHQERPDLNLPEAVWTTAWVVYCKPTVQGTERVLDYLGRYVHRIALTTSRILSIDDGRVCFRYADSRTHRWQTMTLPAQEFIRRFLPHVLPQGFHKVRYDGLWSPVHRPLRHQLQRCLAGHDPSAPLASPDRERRPLACEYAPLQAGQLCPHCGQGLLVVIRLLPRHQRGPPCAAEPPCGLPLPASLGPRVPATAAPSHPCALLPDTMAGTPLPPRPATPGSHPVSGFSPRFPPRWITGTPPILLRMCFPTGPACLKIPYGLELRFSSTEFLCRLRATKTLFRSASPMQLSRKEAAREEVLLG